MLQATEVWSDSRLVFPTPLVGRTAVLAQFSPAISQRLRNKLAQWSKPE